MNDDYVRLAIEALKRRRDSQAAQLEKIDSTINFLSELFQIEETKTMPPGAEPPNPFDKKPFRLAGHLGRSNANKIVPPEPPNKKSQVGGGPLPAAGKPKANPRGLYRVVRKGKRFKGVLARQRKKAIVYETAYWDAKARRSRTAGIFENELEAAMAVAQALGDKDEIQRLAGLIGQVENNPDRPAPKPRVRKTREASPASPAQAVTVSNPVMGWECNRCGRQVLQAERPKVCPNCLKDNGFHEVRERRQKTEDRIQDTE